MLCSPARSGREYWWGDRMEEDAYVRLIREIEVEKGLRAGHERECAQRYTAIEQRFGTFEGKLDKVIQQAEQQDSRIDAWMIWAMAGVFAVMVAVVGWESGQLYALEPQRLAAEAKH